ncbi:MAG TPA: carbohydrate ABC transporter permease [Egibacteraceae bacterium]|nr:carbohydrate ABC transporter permease [Egibacteraceae bacterium]
MPSRRLAASAAANAGLVGVLVWTLFPIFWLLLMSLKPASEAFAFPPKFIFAPTFDAYYQVLFRQAEGVKWVAYWFNSMKVATLSTSIALLIGVPAAYGLVRFPARQRLGLFAILSVRFMPPIVVVIPLLFIMRALKLSDTVLGLSLIHAVFALPFVVWIMIAFFAAIPRDLGEAALVDGAGEWAALGRVMLPIVRPGLVAAALFSALLSWNEFPVALVLTGEAAKTIPVAATTLIAQRTIHWDRVAATGMIAIVPTVIFAAFLQRHLVRGLSAGAVK